MTTVQLSNNEAKLLAAFEDGIDATLKHKKEDMFVLEDNGTADAKPYMHSNYSAQEQENSKQSQYSYPSQFGKGSTYTSHSSGSKILSSVPDSNSDQKFIFTQNKNQFEDFTINPALLIAETSAESNKAKNIQYEEEEPVAASSYSYNVTNKKCGATFQKSDDKDSSWNNNGGSGAIPYQSINMKVAGSGESADSSCINDAPNILSGYYYSKNKKNQPKNEKGNSHAQVIQLKKADFNYSQQSKVRNLMEGEEEIGEVGEWIEKTANIQNQNDDDFENENNPNNNDDDEFINGGQELNAHRLGGVGQIQHNTSNSSNSNNSFQHSQQSVNSSLLGQQQSFYSGNNTSQGDLQQDKTLQLITQSLQNTSNEQTKFTQQDQQTTLQQQQEKINKKLMGTNKTSLSTRQGYMINQLSQKARYIAQSGNGNIGSSSNSNNVQATSNNCQNNLVKNDDSMSTFADKMKLELEQKQQQSKACENQDEAQQQLINLDDNLKQDNSNIPPISNQQTEKTFKIQQQELVSSEDPNLIQPELQNQISHSSNQSQQSLQVPDQIIVQGISNYTKQQLTPQKLIDIKEGTNDENNEDEDDKNVVMLSPQEIQKSKSNHKKGTEKKDDDSLEDEWDMINKQTLQQQNLQENLSVQREIKQIGYSDAWMIVKEKDLTDQIQLLNLNKNQKGNLSFFQRLFSMCSQTKMSRASLYTERDQILAFSRVQFNDQEEYHFRMLYTIFCQLKDTDHCRRYGHHWEEIGFQGTDPATDLRGVGMLGVLQILAFVCQYKDFLKEVLKYSEDETYNFPMSVTLINMTGFVLEWLQQDRLNEQINAEKQVMSILNKAYFAAFFHFFDQYKQSKCTIHQIGHLLNTVKENVGKSPAKFISNFNKKIAQYYKNIEVINDQQQQEN